MEWKEKQRAKVRIQTVVYTMSSDVHDAPLGSAHCLAVTDNGRGTGSGIGKLAETSTVRLLSCWRYLDIRASTGAGTTTTAGADLGADADIGAGRLTM